MITVAVMMASSISFKAAYIILIKDFLKHGSMLLKKISSLPWLYQVYALQHEIDSSLAGKARRTPCFAVMSPRLSSDSCTQGSYTCLLFRAICRFRNEVNAMSKSRVTRETAMRPALILRPPSK